MPGIGSSGIRSSGIQEQVPITNRYQNRASSLFFKEEDISIPRPPFNNTAAQLAFTQITGGLPLHYEEIILSGNNHVGLLQYNYQELYGDFYAKQRDLTSRILYAVIYFIADETSVDKVKVAKFRQENFGTWNVTETPEGEFTVSSVVYSLPEEGKIFIPEDIGQGIPAIERPGMLIGDKAVFEIKGRSALLNFRMWNMQPTKTHKLYVQYFG